MKTPRLKFANLDELALEKLRQMEEATGTLIIAVEPEYPIARLTEDQLASLQQLEEQLGVVLIAYQCI